jgi:hypothetical protein
VASKVSSESGVYVAEKAPLYRLTRSSVICCMASRNVMNASLPNAFPGPLQTPGAT